MKNTREFVEEIQEKQKKDKQNKKRQGNGDPATKLPSKGHP